MLIKDSFQSCDIKNPNWGWNGKSWWKLGGGGDKGPKLVLNWFPGEFHPQYSNWGWKRGWRVKLGPKDRVTFWITLLRYLIVQTSVLWLFEFYNEPVFMVLNLFQNQRTIGFQLFEKESEPKNRRPTYFKP
jgi:hypothetical protein